MFSFSLNTFRYFPNISQNATWIQSIIFLEDIWNMLNRKFILPLKEITCFCQVFLHLSWICYQTEVFSRCNFSISWMNYSFRKLLFQFSFLSLDSPSYKAVTGICCLPVHYFKNSFLGSEVPSHWSVFGYFVIPGVGQESRNRSDYSWHICQKWMSNVIRILMKTMRPKWPRLA